MSEARHDAWQAGESYDGYMGRWSRQLAPRFLDWLGVPNRLDWLDVGCGTGALSGAILARCNPRSLVAIDPSEGFIATARRNVSDQRAEFRVGDAQCLPVESASRDVIASALALNFVPDRHLALAEMRRVARPVRPLAFMSGTILVAVWSSSTLYGRPPRHWTRPRRTSPRTVGFGSATRTGCAHSSQGRSFHRSRARRSRYRRYSGISMTIGCLSPGAPGQCRATAPVSRPTTASD